MVSIHSEEMGRVFALPFTSVETVPGTISEAAIRTLLRRIEADRGADAPVVQDLLDPWITERGSVRRLG